MVKRFALIFLACFFLSLHNGALMYANSSLLSLYFPAGVVSALFFLSSLAGMLFYILAPRLINSIGNRGILLFSLAVCITAVFCLGISPSPLVVGLAFIAYFGFFYLITYSLDIFLEELSSDGFTGEIRGLWIVVSHIGLIAGLAILSIYSGPENLLKPVFLAGAFLLLPTLIISSTFKSDPNVRQQRYRAILPFRTWWRFKSIRRITIARFTLDFFYAFMTIYTPLYLSTVLNFSWTAIGVITGIALLPFVVLQWPAGRLADLFIGEKEILIVAFLFMIGSLLFMPSLGASVTAWALVLFFSRVGASLAETMTDSYFFKRTAPGDTGFLSIFRLTRPLSVALGAATGGFMLNFLSFEKIFYLLAFVVFLGLEEIFLIRDTK